MSDAAPGILVIGGGAVGLCTALALAEAGERVRLVEREPGGENASFGNAGVISPGSMIPNAGPGIWRKIPRWLLDPVGPIALRSSHALRFAPWALRFAAAGRAAEVRRIAAAMHALNHDNVDLYEALLAGTGHEGLIRPSGYLFATRDKAGARLDAFAVALRRSMGFEVERLDATALHREEPALSSRYKAAIALRGGARALSPGRITQVIRDKFLAAGGDAATAEVRTLRPREGGGWRVETDIGPMEAERVALTAGLWSAGLLAPLGVTAPLQSERGYHARFDAAAATLDNSVMDEERKIVASSMEDAMRFAGTAEFAAIDAPPNPKRAAAIIRAAREMVPDLPREPLATWSGQRPSFPDSLPAIGPVPGFSGLSVGFGHSHWGFMMAPRTGLLLADIVRQRPINIDITPYRLDRF